MLMNVATRSRSRRKKDSNLHRSETSQARPATRQQANSPKLGFKDIFLLIPAQFKPLRFRTQPGQVSTVLNVLRRSQTWHSVQLNELGQQLLHALIQV